MTQNRLYELLPIFYRQRDLEQGFPLLAFLNIMELELNILEQNIEELYSNWFIETCEDWVIPYLATLIGTKFSDQTIHLLGTARLQVANTLRNRRRKGTLKSLENILYESTNLPAKIIPYFVKLSMTQNLENINKTLLKECSEKENDYIEKIKELENKLLASDKSLSLQATTLE